MDKDDARHRCFLDDRTTLETALVILIQASLVLH